MDNRKDVHDFLVSRRARVTPAQAGLPTYDGKRSVPGLRREEVASLHHPKARSPLPDTIALDTFNR